MAIDTELIEQFLNEYGYSKLQTIYEDTLDEIAEEERAELFEPLPPTTNFPNQQIFEYEIPVETERLFEQVMRETQLKALFEELLREAAVHYENNKPSERYVYIGLFPPEKLQFATVKSVFKSLNTSSTYARFSENQKYKDYLLLFCDENDMCPATTKDKLKNYHSIITTEAIKMNKHITGIAKKLNANELETRQRNNFTQNTATQDGNGTTL